MFVGQMQLGVFRWHENAAGHDVDATGQGAMQRTGTTKAYSTAQLARLAGVSPQTVQRWVDAGLVAAWRTVGGHRRIDASSADAYLRSLAVAPSRSGRRSRGRSADPVSDRIRVLVVDDQPMQRSILTLEVKHALDDVEVITASSGIEALVLIGRSDPDIVVTDIVMPGIDGFQMIQYLQHSPGIRTPIIIAVSGYDQEQLARMGKLPVTVPILFKPFNSTRLCELLVSAKATVHQRLRPASAADAAHKTSRPARSRRKTPAK
jgi:excisionase family DNA binding protein